MNEREIQAWAAKLREEMDLIDGRIGRTILRAQAMARRIVELEARNAAFEKEIREALLILQSLNGDEGKPVVVKKRRYPLTKEELDAVIPPLHPAEQSPPSGDGT